jgi:hypothetical protein
MSRNTRDVAVVHWNLADWHRETPSILVLEPENFRLISFSVVPIDVIVALINVQSLLAM